eukprot:640967-Hanusia_phi.AAC.1
MAQSDHRARAGPGDYRTRIMNATGTARHAGVTVRSRIGPDPDSGRAEPYRTDGRLSLGLSNRRLSPST